MPLNLNVGDTVELKKQHACHRLKLYGMKLAIHFATMYL